MRNTVPGQSLRKQLLVSCHSPLHSEPPYEGPLHSRVLCIVPLEQEEEQGVHPDHSFQEPSTMELARTKLLLNLHLKGLELLRCTVPSGVEICNSNQAVLLTWADSNVAELGLFGRSAAGFSTVLRLFAGTDAITVSTTTCGRAQTPGCPFVPQSIHCKTASLVNHSSRDTDK